MVSMANIFGSNPKDQGSNPCRYAKIKTNIMSDSGRFTVITKSGRKFVV